jgi:phospholipid N-methyltransferase
MIRRIREYLAVFGEFRRTYRTTGTLLPSSRPLSRALARYVRQGVPESDDGSARRILEVGPGTGPVTRSIVEALRPTDQLDLVELNDTFVDVLRGRFDSEAPFQSVADQVRILHQPVQELLGEPPYDVIISGLPLNNFEVDEVEEILDVLRQLLAPGGTLSFFEYIAIRKAKAAISGSVQCRRLRGVAQAVGQLLAEGEFKRDCVLTNVPPAWVHHVRNVGVRSEAAASHPS